MPIVKPGVFMPLEGNSGILGCINEHDGSGFIHALLETYHPAYARLLSDQYRTHLAKSVRIGALPSILRTRFGSNPLCADGCREARSLFNRAIAYGSPLPQTLLADYAKYLGVSYRLFDADLFMIEEFTPPDSDVQVRQGNEKTCNIITTADDEYHLLVDVIPSKRGDPEGFVRFRAQLDAKLSVG